MEDLILKKDEELVALSLENKENFVFLVNKYEKKLLSYIMRISNVSYEEAQDLLQDVFIKIYINLNDFDKTLKFSSWVYRIAHNEVINNFRKTKSRPEKIIFQDNDELLDTLISDLNIEQDIDNQILREKILNALQRLDIKYREVIVLKFLEERNYEEISDILKKPMGTIATLLNRAKKHLKNILVN